MNYSIKFFNKKCNKKYLKKVKKDLSYKKVDLYFVYKYVPFLIDYYIKNKQCKK